MTWNSCRRSVWHCLPQHCPRRPPCQVSKQNMVSLQAFEAHNSHLWEIQLALMGIEPRRARSPELLHAAAAGVHSDWGVIGLSHRLVCFPMWATAAGRPRGTIWKQHDTLQCWAGIQGRGRDVSQLSKGLLLGLLLKMSCISENKQ